jgi:alkylation response protein AidB-like acyl-CoA dehydrogenase
MDLSYTETQELLRQTARDFAQRDFPIRRHRELVETKTTFDPETWQKMAGLGWPGLMVDEAHGGTGGNWVDLIVLLEEMGRALLPMTFLAHALAGLVIQRYGDEAQRRALLPAVAGGERTFAVAITEPRATLDRAGIQCEARRADGGYTLHGTKHFVRGAGAADTLVVLARLDDQLGIFLVEKAAEGVTVTPLDTIGDDDQARVELAGVRVPGEALLGGAPQGWDALQAIADMGALIECGYGVGVMARDTEVTIGYVKDRVQFGRPIGSFQAVHHQVADQVTDVDCGRLLTLYAAWVLDEGQPAASIEIARAKAWTSDALRRVARTGNQLHGGIGFSREYDIHFYFQRAKTNELMFGIADEHRERIAAALLDS